MKTYDILAAVDLGSNSFRLEIARVAGEQLFPLDALKETVRLAGGLDAEKNLDAPTQARALACLARFGERLRGLPAEAVRAVGTSTLRIARNADAFLEQAQRALGHRIEVVAGREEARLIYLGVAHGLPASPHPRLVVDIGGGSTEVIVGKGVKPLQRESLNMGCVNFSQRFFADGVLDKATLKAAEIAARAEAEGVASAFDASHWHEAIGSSGTARALRDILEQNGLSAAGITADGLARLKREFIKAGHVSRLRLAGLREDRRPVIAGGFAILSGLFAELRIETMQVAETAMREGILYDLLGRFHERDMRDVTVESLTRRHEIDTAQAARVERAVRELSGNTPETLQRLLGWAARLHEIGLGIAHSGYHRHSAYILGNADMPGFSRNEQADLAVLVRTQRGSLAKARADAAHVARWLAGPEQVWIAILRLAVILHRARRDTGIAVPALDATPGRYRLRFPGGWLEAHPLTAKALEAEAADWAAIGVDYRFE
jgi:exopolyphosphatase/guanosine-5'-triphosphate,3'-diphosphate pyrophosphatase